MADAMGAGREAALAGKKTDEINWKVLLHRIKKGRCTPFLGSEACFGTIPQATELAKELAEDFDYPYPRGNDGYDLAHVAQFVATHEAPDILRDWVVERLKAVPLPGFEKSDEPDEPHVLLARLPLPVYITTTHVDFMMQALLARKDKKPRCDWCRWHEGPAHAPSNLDSGFMPTVAEPVVYHLHGHRDVPGSLVLTEDDYLDFLRLTSEDQKLIHPIIQESFTKHSLLFLGYRLEDMEFRVLLRSLVKHLQINITRAHMLPVQLITVGEMLSTKQVELANDYLKKYFRDLNISVYWGRSREFVAELRGRWDEFNAQS